MASYTKLGQADWELIRVRYIAGESPRVLAMEFGIAESTLYRRKELESWPKGGSVHENGGQDFQAYNEVREISADTSLLPDLPSNNGSNANAHHVSTARQLRKRINRLLAGDNHLGSSPDRQPQAIKDLTMALEKLQRIERLALGLDKGLNDPQAGVIILVPGKSSEKDWLSSVAQAS